MPGSWPFRIHWRIVVLIHTSNRMMPVLPPRQVPGNGAFGSIRGVLRPELHRTVLLGEVTLKLGLPERKGESGKVEELAKGRMNFRTRS